MPTISVRVKDKNRLGGDEIIGVCSIPLEEYLPRWEAVAAAFITRFRKGQLRRRRFKQIKSVKKVQNMWRARQARKLWVAALQDARRSQGLPAEQEPLLPRRSNAKKASRDAKRARARSRSAVVSIQPGKTSPAPEVGHRSAPLRIGWQMKERRVRNVKHRKDEFGKPAEVTEDTITKTFHQLDCTPSNRKDESGKPVDNTKDSVLVPQRPAPSHPDRNKASSSWEAKREPGDEAPSSVWQWDAETPESCRMEYAQELEEVQTTPNRKELQYQGLFKRFPLTAGSEVGNGKTQQVGVLKAIVRIVDHSAPTAFASEDDSSSGQAQLDFQRSDIGKDMPGLTAKNGDRIEEVLALFPSRAASDVRSHDRELKWDVRIRGREIRWNPTERADQSGHVSPVGYEECVPTGPAPSWNEDNNDLDLVSCWRFGYNDTLLQDAVKDPKLCEQVDAKVKHYPRLPRYPVDEGPDAKWEWAGEPDPSDGPYKEPPPTAPGTLEVTVIKATKLRDLEFFGSMDPYIKLTLVESEEAIRRSRGAPMAKLGVDEKDEELKEALDECVKKTRTIKGGGANDVLFGQEKLELHVDRGDQTLRIEAFDEESYFKADDFIGRFDFSLDDLLGGDAPHDHGKWPNKHHRKSVRLFSDKRGKRYAGEVELKMTFKQQEEGVHDRPVPPLNSKLKARARQLVQAEIARRWDRLKRAYHGQAEPEPEPEPEPEWDSSLIPEPEVGLQVQVGEGKTSVWGAFQTSQVSLRDVQERLDMDDEEGHWEHLWSKFGNFKDRHFPCITWLYPAGAWIMCAGHAVHVGQHRRGRRHLRDGAHGACLPDRAHLAPRLGGDPRRL